MNARSSWRIPIRLNVKLTIRDKVYTGTATNISESGMFISTDETGFSKDSLFDISIPVKEGELHVPGRLIRSAKINSGSEGIGIKLSEQPQGYLDFIENLLFVL